MSEERAPRRPRGRRPRRKVCAFCADKSIVIDYKDVPRLKRFLSERGKILPRRMSGCCAKHQRELAIAIKRARIVALIPYVAEG
ncbi:30S ribosomal protein S18 [Eubacteriales bacterium OttesenSCG-928-N14]|nr:30S ribosomal protein S18 [Eubacteriales bacterium OttesenSCG-928-N14]